MQRDTGGTRGTGSTRGTVGTSTAATAPGTATAPARQATASGNRSGGSPRDAVPQGGDLDLDDLARRLLDPVARLLRTELRRGRERAGRPFDGRR
ncbi:hypothetical protein ACGFZP_27340 [Kitasatospora sp. NPDC048239]|uniref:hypothetical protein n=1 Tax=Kitasatospora sp. NPDC048239 TaxID=3364046 RepID=UPI00371D0FC4